jgi:hypothetical protein
VRVNDDLGFIKYMSEVPTILAAKNGHPSSMGFVAIKKWIP